MSKGKKIYFLVLLLITILVTTFYFSYAIFSNTKEEHGKLNIVAGTLNYKIESSELDSDSITLPANTSKEIKIKLTSLNEVSSKYELYYILDKTNENVSVGYSKDTKDNVLGTIEGSSSKMISIVVRNDSDTSSKVTFKVLGGLVNNELALKDGNSLNQEVSLCKYVKGYVWNFDYTGGEQEFVMPCSGEYKLETWGAQGGTAYVNHDSTGGVGGYSYGNILLNKNSSIYINVGGSGVSNNNSKSSIAIGGYNGGGAGGGYNKTIYGEIWTGSGGGATHIAIKSGQLSAFENYINNIIIVSGGGGGGYYHNNSNLKSWGPGGAGGGVIGGKGKTYGNYNPGLGGTQTGFQLTKDNAGYPPKFGAGGYGELCYDQLGNHTNGGGGGLYGGSAAIHAGAGGGSGYIGNPLLTNKTMYCYNCEESTEKSTKTISTTCTSETPTENCSKQGNGYARITYLGN